MILKCESGEEIEVGAFIAPGGMAEVYEGKRIGDGKRLAVKFPLPDVGDEALALFLDEAAAAAEVDHPNVVKVLEWGDDDRKFIAFEYVDGSTLAEFAGQADIAGGAIDLEMFRDVSIQLCEGLSAIHSMLIHRDLKPSNVLLDNDGTFKIGDFGLAKYINESTRTVTLKGWGTPGYRAPETLHNESADIRTDQLALGIMLWELLTGNRAFPGPNVTTQELYSVPQGASDLREDVPLSVSGVLKKMMSKRMDDRYESVSEACRELHESLGSSMTAQETEQESDSPFVSQMAQMATQVFDTRRQAELDNERQAAEERAAIEDRSALVAHEFSVLKEELRSNVEKINQGAGAELMRYTEGRSGNSAMIEIEGWRLNVVFQETAPTNEHYVGWGSAEVSGPLAVPEDKGYIGTHFVLDKERPYPNWATVVIEIPTIIPTMNIVQVRGQRIRGRKVLAIHEDGLMEARSHKGRTGVIQWKESGYSHTEFVQEHLKALLEFAHEYPAPPSS